MRFFSVATCLMLIVAVSGSLRAADAERPNFLFILADDLGWGDLGCYGHPQLQTPHLDGLARQGTLFTHFYVNASVCSPSRCAFFTGQYPARHRIHGHYSTPEQNAARGMSQWLPTEVPNVAALLQKQGYRTAHIGKWHLGNNSGGPPVDQYGFDFVGTSELGGANGPPDDQYSRARSSELFVDEAIKFLRQESNRPFYLQLWTLVPHATLNPTEEQLRAYPNLGAGGKSFPHKSAAQIYYSSVTDLDRQLGRLFAELDRLKIAENTVVFFSSDNGPEDIHIRNAGHSGIGSAGPFRGRKRSLYEGGIRVPGILRWPGHVPAGKIDEQNVLAAVDWLPTVCRLAKVRIPEKNAIDGEDVQALWRGETRPRKKPLLWEWRFNIAGEPVHHSPQLAIRDGNWKLLMNPDRSRVELYDMTTDHLQMTNLAERHADVVDRLSAQLLAWQQSLPPGPRDPRAGEVRLTLPGTSLPPRARRNRLAP